MDHELSKCPKTMIGAGRFVAVLVLVLVLSSSLVWRMASASSTSSGRGVFVDLVSQDSTTSQMIPPSAAIAHAVTGGVVPCVNDQAHGFACQHVDLLSFLPAAAIGAKTTLRFNGLAVIVNDMWGWTDSMTSRAFAVVGRVDGTAFVEVTDPVHPKYLGELPLHSGAWPSSWRDIKVYKHHAFIVADGAGPHGMQVFDLTQLRDVRSVPRTFQETAHYDRIASAHNIAINEATGYAYIVSANGAGETCGGGLHMVDVRDPEHPTFTGCYDEPQAKNIHDTQCVVYHGPDPHYQGRELCFNASGDAVTIADVTDKQAPVTISLARYPKVGFTHQGWLTDDQRYFFLGDEADERQYLVSKTRTIAFDLSDLADPLVVEEFLGTTAATDHNLYLCGRYMYQANYQAGLRVIDVQDPTRPAEVGFFDTTPEDQNTSDFAGAWTAYPYFQTDKDRIVAVSSISEGLFLLRFRPEKR